MKILIERTKLIALLNNANSFVIAKKSTIPAIQNVKMTIVSETQIEIASTNLDVYLKEQMEAKAQADLVGKAYILDSKFMSGLLSKLDGDSITIEFFKSTAKLTTNGTSYTLPFYAGEDFPDNPKIGKNLTSLDFEGDTLKEYLKKCFPFVSPMDETTPVFSGIHLTIKDKALKMEASTRAVVLRTTDTIDAEDTLDVVLPAQFASIYLKVYNEENAKLSMDKMVVQIVGEHFQLYGRLVEGKYPAIEKLFEQDFPSSIKLKRETLIPALKRLLLVNNTSKISKWSIGKELVIESENKEFQMKGREVFEFSHDGENIEIGLNPEFIIKSLMAFGSDDVTMKYLAPNKLVHLMDESGQIDVLIAPLQI